MVFVVLGTWEMPFIRPLIEIEKAAAQGLLAQPIVVQSGKTSYESPNLKLVPFFGKEDLERMYDQASLLICQAGVGSIILGLRKRKKIIAIARRRMFNEHIDDHQLEILDLFSKAGTILPWSGNSDLPQVLERARDFVPSDYPFAEERISGAILEYLSVTTKSR
ncbi:MAG: glycosyltransferase [Steroidobacteraceae bacterium]